MIRHLAILALTALALPAVAAIEINQATQAQLETLRGVGPSLSTRILEARKTAPFKTWADLQERVSGVGPGSAARLSKAGLTVAGSAYTATPKSRKGVSDPNQRRAVAVTTPAAQAQARPQPGKTPSK